MNHGSSDSITEVKAPTDENGSSYKTGKKWTP